MRFALVACPLLSIATNASAEIDRAGNLLGDDGPALPKWALGLAGIGLIGYGLKNSGAADKSLAIGLGIIVLLAAALI